MDMRGGGKGLGIKFKKTARGRAGAILGGSDPGRETKVNDRGILQGKRKVKWKSLNAGPVVGLQTQLASRRAHDLMRIRIR